MKSWQLSEPDFERPAAEQVGTAELRRAPAAGPGAAGVARRRRCRAGMLAASAGGSVELAGGLGGSVSAAGSIGGGGSAVFVTGARGNRRAACRSPPDAAGPSGRGPRHRPSRSRRAPAVSMIGTRRAGAHCFLHHRAAHPRLARQLTIEHGPL